MLTESQKIKAEIAHNHFISKKKQTKPRAKREKYEKIESHKRRQLLYLVNDLKVSIKEASDSLQVNYSTAKTILQLFRKTGRIDRLERKYLLSEAAELSDHEESSTKPLTPSKPRLSEDDEVIESPCEEME